ncbi:MAG TPA: EAL domain-containing protein [Gammaproteobacteria bacterium]|nr:EAL domain-containing protein [Gammaproteobacteria bacterium]
MDAYTAVEAVAQISGARWVGLSLAGRPAHPLALAGDSTMVERLAASPLVATTLERSEPLLVPGLGEWAEPDDGGLGDEGVVAFGGWPLTWGEEASAGALFLGHDRSLDLEALSPLLASFARAVSGLHSMPWYDLYREALAHATAGVTIADPKLPDSPLIYVNQGFQALTGYPADELIGRNCRFLQGADRDQPGVAALRRAVTEGTSCAVELRNYRRDGSQFWNYVRLAPIEDSAGEVAFFVGVQLDVTELRQFQEENLVPQRDPSTGLPNQAALRARLEGDLAAFREGGTPPAMLLLRAMDLDEVLELLGVEAGDALIREIGQRVAAAHPELFGPFRFSNSELAFVAPASPPDPDRLAREVGNSASEPVTVNDVPLRIEPAVGTCAAPPSPEASPEEMIRRARVALGSAIDARSEWRHYHPGQERAAIRAGQFLARIKQALTDHELELHYQPKIRLRDGGLAGVEALVRWRQPGKGLVPPGHFLPKLEETRLINTLTRFVVREAVAAAEAGVPTPIAVNLSTRNLQDPELIDEIIDQVTAWSGEPDAFEIEITEGALLVDPETAIHQMQRMREAGLGIAIDDFGTGEASYRYLRRIPASGLKIDRAFVRDLDREPRAAALFASMVQAGHALGLAVTAEGIESESQARAVGEAGADLGQGFLWQAAVPAAELGPWVRSRSAK